MSKKNVDFLFSLRQKENLMTILSRRLGLSQVSMHHLPLFEAHPRLLKSLQKSKIPSVILIWVI